MNRSNRGFTLIELLVVITIIGVLVALLIPGVNAVREQGRQTICRNNLDNIGKAVLAYELAKGHLPGILNQTQSPTNVPVQFNWAEAILPNLEHADIWTQVLTGTINANSIANGQQVPFIKIFTCPDDPYLGAPTSTNYQGLLSYGINDGFFVDLRTNPPKDLSNHTVAATTSTKLTSRPNLSQSLYARGENVSPSTTIMLGDMTGDGTAAYPHVSGPWTMTSTVTAAVPAGATALSFHWPVQYGTFQPVTPELISPKMMISAHPGKVVVVFFDGHDDSIANDSTYPQ